VPASSPETASKPHATNARGSFQIYEVLSQRRRLWSEATRPEIPGQEYGII